jgi:hypothetical protein
VTEPQFAALKVPPGLPEAPRIGRFGAAFAAMTRRKARA